MIVFGTSYKSLLYYKWPELLSLDRINLRRSEEVRSSIYGIEGLHHIISYNKGFSIYIEVGG